MTGEELRGIFRQAKEICEIINANELAIRLLVDESGEARRQFGNRVDMGAVERAAMNFADRLAPLIVKRVELESQQRQIMAIINPLAEAIIKSKLPNADRIYTAIELCYIQGISANKAGIEMGYSQREVQRFNKIGLEIMNKKLLTMQRKERKNERPS